MNKFVVGMIVLVVVFVGFLLFSRSDDASDTENVEQSQHVLGEGTSGVTFVEFADFECPACFAYHPTMRQIKEHYGDQIKFQFKHFPLTTIHPKALAAHKAAEAAGNQDKFWEMHDILFDRQNDWKVSSSHAALFEEYAQELGLDLERFRADVISRETNSIINLDMREGLDLGVNSTPTFFINGEKIEDAQNSFEFFKALIDQAISAQSQESSEE